MVNFHTKTAWLQPDVSAYSKGHSIVKAISRGEVTIAIMAGFSNAFHTLAYETFLCKDALARVLKSSLGCEFFK